MIDAYFLNPGLAELILTCVVMIAIPGPSIMFLVGQALSSGRSYALRGVIGNALGTYAVAIIVAIGVGSMFSHYGNLTSIIRIFGAAVLGWIGFRYIRPNSTQPADLAQDVHASKSNSNPLASGFIVGVTNPKAMIIFGAVVPSFMPDKSNPIGTLLAYSLVPVGLGVAIDSAWVWIAHLARSTAHDLGRKRKVHLIGGWLMILMALMLLRDALSAII